MTVNHLVPGSIPGAGATNTQTSQQKHLEEFYNTFNPLFTTFLQQTKQQEDFLNQDTKYLQMIGNTYYFVKRVNGKIFKKTLKTSNLKKANILKAKILKGLKSMISNLNTDSGLKIAYVIEEGDDEEEAKKIIEASKRSINNKVSKVDDKITTLTTETIYENTFTTIKEEEQKFYDYCKKTKSNIEDRTIEEYKTSFKYLYFKFSPETKIYDILKYEDWDNFRDFLITLPNKFLRRYGSKKWGSDIDKIIDFIVKEDEEQDKNPESLSARTINKHFNVLSMFLDYLETTQKISKNPIKNIKELVEYPNPYQNFTNEDLGTIWTKIQNKEILNFINVAIYSGLRLSAIINIQKKDIDLNTFKLVVQKDKTTNGERTIIIHNKLRKLFTDFVNSKREFLFFNTNDKDKVQKRINPLLFEVWNDPNKLDII